MRLATKLGIAVAAITAGVVMAPTTAMAASWNPISGTCYSSGDWYTSTNVRWKSGSGPIQVRFSSLPAHGLKFYVRNYNTGLRMGIIGYFPPIDTTVTLASSVGGGTPFVNVFALKDGSGGGNYNFNGSEYY